MNPRTSSPLRPALTVLISSALSGCVAPHPAALPAPPVVAVGKGVNYMTGNGLSLLQAEEANVMQIALDVEELKQLNVKWVRIETAMSQGGAAPDVAAQVSNLIDPIVAAGLEPLLDVLAWHYPDAGRAAYRAWLTALLAGPAKDVAVFEIGNEPNLNVYSESGGVWDPQGQTYSTPYPGYVVEEQPYGWDLPEHLVDPGTSDPNQYLGSCPTTGDLSAYRAAVGEFVDLLKDSYAIIKQARPNATVIAGGLSSWQAVCFLRLLGEASVFQYADAIGWHAYPVGSSSAPGPSQTPERGAASLDLLNMAMDGWPKRLPVWITEYGFQTPTNYATYTSDGFGDAVKDEVTKAAYDAQQLQMMRTQKAFTGPIILYSAVDYPVSAGDWRDQDKSGNEGGFGLWEWCHPDGSGASCATPQPLKLNPAFTQFAAAGP